MNHLVRAIACTLILSGSLLQTAARDKKNRTPAPVKGIVDLRNYNLSSSPVSLNGEWEFYWKQLIQPGSASRDTAFVNFPSLWKKQRFNGTQLTSQGYGTYAVTILLPKEKPLLGLGIPDVYSSYKLFVNGILMAQNGEPSADPDKAIPFWTSRTITVPSSDTLRLVLQVANYWHTKGGTYKSIAIGSREKIVQAYYMHAAFDLVLSGCLFMGGLFFFGLFMFGRDKTILFFSLFCMVYSYRMVGTDLYILHALFPNLNWFVTIRIEYLALVLSIGLFAQYTRLLYPQEGSSWAWKVMLFICGVYGATVIFLKPIWFTGLLPNFLGTTFAFIAYGTYIYIQAYRHRRPGSSYALLSSGVMLLVFFIINLQYFEVVQPLKGLIFGGYIAFFFLQSMVLSYRFSETLKKAAEDAQQALKAKSAFLSNMSHEIRTPLNSVIGMAYLLQRNKPRPDQQKNLEVLMFSGKNLLSIVNNILDYNKIEEGKIQFENVLMDIPAIARNIVAGMQSMADDKRILLHVHIDGRLTRKVKGDPTRMSQVITNLLHNAIKFTKEGSVLLELRVDRISGRDITVTTSVSDTGIGIPEDKWQLIFDRFTQADSSTSRKYGGAGLGLAICNKILELQGVKLRMTSELKKGSCFYFTQTFEMSTENVEAITSIPLLPEQSKPFKGISMLLVEDNPMNVLVAQTFLERCGAHIDVATNGMEALKLFNRKKHRLVLMDLDMPEMDGYEATRRLRQQGETLPVIALTASLPNEIEKKVYEAGLTNIIVKPFNPDDLFRVLLQYMNQERLVV